MDNWRELIDRYRAGTFDPSRWNWCVAISSVPHPLKEGVFVRRACVFVMGTGGEQCLASFSMGSPDEEGLEKCRKGIRTAFGITDIQEGVG